MGKTIKPVGLVKNAKAVINDANRIEILLFFINKYEDNAKKIKIVENISFITSLLFAKNAGSNVKSNEAKKATLLSVIFLTDK